MNKESTVQNQKSSPEDQTHPLINTLPPLSAVENIPAAQAAAPLSTAEPDETPAIEPLILGHGDLLQKKRCDLNISLDQVSRALRIQIRYLKAIEENDFSVLPERVFTLGFVRSYAQYLGLEGSQFVILYRAILDNVRPDEVRKMLSSKESNAQRYQKNTGKKTTSGKGHALSKRSKLSAAPQWLILLGAVILTSGIIGTWFYLSPAPEHMNFLDDMEATENFAFSETPSTIAPKANVSLATAPIKTDTPG